MWLRIVNFNFLSFYFWHLLFEIWSADFNSLWLSFNFVLLLYLEVSLRFDGVLSQRFSFHHVSTIYHLYDRWLRLLNVKMHGALGLGLRLERNYLLFYLVVAFPFFQVPSFLASGYFFVVHILWKTVLGILPLLQHIFHGDDYLLLRRLFTIIWNIFIIFRLLVLFVEVFVQMIVPHLILLLDERTDASAAWAFQNYILFVVFLEFVRDVDRHFSR